MKTEDPRITAYALGELHGPARDDFEKELAASTDLQQDLAEAVALCHLLTDLAPGEDALTDDQRASLRDECLKNTRIARRRIVTRQIVVGSSLAALAACLVLLPISPWFLFPRSPELIAKQDFETTVSVPIASPPPFPDQPAFVLPEPQQPQTSSTMMALTTAAPPPSGDRNLEMPVQRLNVSDAAIAGRDQFAAMTVSASAAATPVADALVVRGEAIAKLDDRSAVVSAKPAEPTLQASLAGGKTAQRGDGRSFREELVADKSKQWAAAVPSKDWDSLYMFRGVNVLEAQRDASLPSSNESYELPAENVFLTALENPLSTFSIDVDTASYANIRRMLLNDQRPPADAVRVEEMINYFTYNYPQPKGDSPFTVNVEATRAPWAPQHELVRIGLKGREIPQGDRQPANLVFLVDVSGSMNSEDKLPLLQRSLDAMVRNLAPDDRVAIVVYAGASGLVLPSTPGKDRQRILDALANLKAGGSTNGAAGIQLAYQLARDNFAKGGNNRVILCTDGDFNVGVTSQDDLVSLIERERASGVFLSVLGFGTGNLKDSTMEKLADKGNGNYAYIDSFSEGRKVLVDQMNSTIFTIAKDVKIQVEFNPARVAGYRLIGYENRLLAKEDFNNDKKDAGEIGAGHTVTALYEIVPAGQPLPGPSVDPLKYQTVDKPLAGSTLSTSNDLLTVKLRYKAPDGDKSQLLTMPVPAGSEVAFDKASSDFQFATAVAAFGMKLRGSESVADFPWKDIQSIARRNLGEDPGSYRAEFLTLLEKASRLQGEPSAD